MSTLASRAILDDYLTTLARVGTLKTHPRNIVNAIDKLGILADDTVLTTQHNADKQEKKTPTPTKDTGDPMRTVSYVADLLGVSKMTIYRLVENGDLPAIVIGKRTIRIRQSEIDNYIASALV